MNITELVCKNAKAKINLSRGANCISLHIDGLNVLREPDYARFDNPYLYGMPPLFPVNRLSGGKFLFEGRKYDFGINEKETMCQLHGDLHSLAFEVSEKRDDYVRCTFESFGEYMNFPHPFRFEIEYELKENGLYITVGAENRSPQNMPFLFGFHTTFNMRLSDTTDISEVVVGAEVGQLIERGEDYLPTGNFICDDQITRDLCDGIFRPANEPVSRHYKASKKGNMFIYDTRAKKGVLYQNDPAYTHRLIYNGSADEYICLEPQNCQVDAPNDFRCGVPFIAPGEKTSLSSSITVFER